MGLPKLKRIFFLIVANFSFLMATVHAQAEKSGWCGSIFKSMQVGCQNLSDSNSLGGSYPMLFDAFNINPSSLPTYPTPLGVEMFVEKGNANFAFIKGVEKIGTGLSSFSTDASFFSNVSNLDVMGTKPGSNLSLPTAGERYDPKINYGNAINLYGSGGDSAVSINIGGNLKYNRTTRELEKGAGLVVKSKNLNLSYAYTSEARASVLITTTLGLRLGNFIYDYSYMNNSKGVVVTTAIHSFTYGTKSFTLNLAYRRQDDPAVTDDVISALDAQGIVYSRGHTLAGANWRPNDHFRIGVYSNYVIGQNLSFLFQYIF